MSSDDRKDAEQEQEIEQLAALREEIDRVDMKLLEELADPIRERTGIVKKIGALKKRLNRQVTDKDREEVVVRDRMERGRSKGLSGEMVRKIWKAIIDDAKEHE